MSKRILTDNERKELLAKYKTDKLNDAPANITDATLIKNYGTDEQKALLETAKKPDEGKKDETASAGNGTNADVASQAIGQPGTVEGSGSSNQTDAEKAAKTRDYELGLYKELYGVDFSSTVEGGNIDHVPTEEIAAFNVWKRNEIERDSNTETPEYIAELNNYISLNEGKAPEKQLKLSELRQANVDKILSLQSANAQSQNESMEILNANSNPAHPNLQSTITNKNPDKVTLVNTETRQVKKFTKHTYEQYMKNDKVWILAPETPDEVKHLTNG